MAKSYTENDLLYYLYNEMSAEDAEKLETALIFDVKLQTALSNLKAGMTVLGNLEEEPSPTSVELILEYSAASLQTLEEV